MQEIRCPHCGEVFQVDEAGYAAIVKQVRDKEFEKEIAQRESAAVQLAVSQAEQKKDQELNRLHMQLEALKQSGQAERDRLRAQSEMEQLKDRQTIDQLQKDLSAQMEKARDAVRLAVQEQQLKIQALESELRHE